MSRNDFGNLRFLRGVFAGLLCWTMTSDLLSAADWPMWRYDAARSASSSESLSDSLELRRTLTFGQRVPAWDDALNQDLMTYDRILEPVVVSGRLIVAFNDRDQVAAFDTQSGKQFWSVFTEGPVRLPPAGWEGRVYFASDDGYLYCVDVNDGSLIWKFRGGPNSRQILGNRRLISAWPMRGGPVVRDGVVYCAAGIWPFMGTYLYALDAQTGEIKWVNDETGAQYIKQPHSAPSFAGVGPQGALVATGDTLLVPGGRSVPAAFDLHTGAFRYFELNAGGKGTGGSFLCANDDSWFVHTRLRGTREFSLKDGIKTAFQPNEPVLSGNLIYSAEFEKDVALIRCYEKTSKAVLWEVAADGRGDLIQAGQRLYAASVGLTSESGPATLLTAIDLPSSNQQVSSPNVTAHSGWTTTVPGTVERLLAADGQLIAVTLQGDIHLLGATDLSSPSQTIQAADSIVSLPQPELRDADLATGLQQTGAAEGYAFWMGVDDEQLPLAMAFNSRYAELTVVDSDATVVSRLRSKLDQAGLYGRVTVRLADETEFRAPPYIANQIFVGRRWSERIASDPVQLGRLYESVRPYGGVICFLLDPADVGSVRNQLIESKLEQAKYRDYAFGISITRVGPLPGAGEWTHQYGDIGNTIKSNDQRVRLPLGVLWFGGVSHNDILPRHGHGPPEQVIGGRLFIQGMDSLTARDVYTGRVLWSRKFSNLGTHDVYFDDTYKDTPLDPAYNQVHIPGANARGTNYVVTADRIYILEGAVCHVLDPVNGETLLDISLPQEDNANPNEWGYIGVYGDVLLGGVGFAKYRTRHELDTAADAELSASKAGFGTKSLDRAASMSLVGFNRRTGEVLWKNTALHSFWHNGIVAGNGRVYVLDKNPKPVEDFLKRRGKSDPSTYRIASFDAQTGETIWERPGVVFGTWLGYSATEDLLLQAGSAASDRLSSEVGQGMSVYRGTTGELVWEKPELKYAGPCVLHNNLIITNANAYSESAGAFRLTDGGQKMAFNPLTGKSQPWKMTRAYGCNNIIASENLLTFRSGAAGFYDLLSDSGTGNLGGFKSGCTSNLVVADGVLNAPDYTRTCSCAYQNQTSLALVHMPEIDLWTVANTEVIENTDGRVRHVGINLGAPGDRRAPDGTMWLEYPAVAGDSPNFGLTYEGTTRLFQDQALAQDQTTVRSEDSLPWVTSSGIEGLTSLRLSLQPLPRHTLKTGLPVVHPNEDAEEASDGSVSLDSSSLEMGQKDNAPQLVAYRYSGLRLKPDSEIRSAHLQFVVRSDQKEPALLKIRAEASGNAEPLADATYDISKRPLTKTEVLWTPEAWEKEGTSGDAQKSPDLSPLIREVVERDDWKPGNAIVFVVSGTGTRVSSPNRGADSKPTKLLVDADEAPLAESEKLPPQAYRVELHFGLPRESLAHERTFTVHVEGGAETRTVTIGGSAGPQQVTTLDRVLLDDWLDLGFTAENGAAVISGIELERLDE
ncbi:MAG: PQQ-binding-like beta-propeller repeat protein [Planctomyces sp.]|nr:PQQ-binding-like beta-propeller repeat protein [Planctomyces sp.]